MDKNNEEFMVSDKFKSYENQGIAAPQVLTFLDNIATMLKAVANDIERAIVNIEQVRIEEAEEAHDTADAS